MEKEIKHCHQYLMKQQKISDDLEEYKLSIQEVSNLNIRDLNFKFINKNELNECRKISKFIEKYEWLKKMPNRPTHRFVAFYKKIIIAVNIFATPYSKSNLLGEENWGLEKLIARGASISFAPSNIGSWLIMKSIKWMVNNTDFRFFTSYCDTQANELGTIYQACNFIYLGKNAGGSKEYFDPCNPEKGWFSDRVIRRFGMYKKSAKELGIKWEENWNNDDRILWNKIPKELSYQIKDNLQNKIQSFLVRKSLKKHKYVFIIGKNKNETKKLLKIFYQHNPTMIPKGPNLRPGALYPKTRGL